MKALLQKLTKYPFFVLWVILCLLYLPARRAGFVTDAIDWLQDIHSLGFWDYLNRSNSTIHALYQFTQLSSLGFYKLFGVHRLPWFLLFTLLQAVNGYLLFKICKNFFQDARLKNAGQVAFVGALLFCVSPYLSEVLVWKACYHYLQSFLMMLLVLRSLQLYLKNPRKILPVFAALLFFLSSFSLEIFYLTPILSASIIWFYSKIERPNKSNAVKTLLLFVLPQVLVFGFHLLLFHRVYGEWISHGNSGILALPIAAHFSKFLDYIFHLFFFGRFWPQALKEKAYLFFEKPTVFFTVSALALGLISFVILKIKSNIERRLGLLLGFWMLLAIAFVLPLPLEHLFDTAGNRYLYLVIAFAAVFFSFLGSIFLEKIIKVLLLFSFLGVSCFLTLRSNRHWQTSEQISSRLLRDFPNPNGRTIIFLNLPYCYKGIPMINAWPYGNFKRMHNMLYSPSINVPAYDGAAFNMVSPNDGATAEYVNDSTIKITLEQWGTWWWYKDFGGYSYETPDYALNMRDQGHWYELTMKKPRENFLILYLRNGAWNELK
ncbi:MAG: hypothetical protein ABI378_00440 [Chitinophagaceae bacterium]